MKEVLDVGLQEGRTKVTQRSPPPPPPLLFDTHTNACPWFLSLAGPKAHSDYSALRAAHQDEVFVRAAVFVWIPVVNDSTSLSLSLSLCVRSFSPCTARFPTSLLLFLRREDDDVCGEKGCCVRCCCDRRRRD